MIRDFKNIKYAIKCSNCNPLYDKKSLMLRGCKQATGISLAGLLYPTENK